MAQNKRRTKRKTGKDQPTTPNGIVVRLEPQENGDQAIKVATLGQTKLTEAPTILRLAAQTAEHQLGIRRGGE